MLNDPQRILSLYDSLSMHFVEIIESATEDGFNDETEMRLVAALSVVNQLIGLPHEFDINNSSHRQAILGQPPEQGD